MKGLRETARAVAPWVGTIAAGVVLALSVSGGCNFVRPEHRALAPLTGTVLATRAQVTNQALLGKPAIINVWSPG